MEKFHRYYWHDIDITCSTFTRECRRTDLEAGVIHTTWPDCITRYIADCAAWTDNAFKRDKNINITEVRMLYLTKEWDVAMRQWLDFHVVKGKAVSGVCLCSCKDTAGAHTLAIVTSHFMSGHRADRPMRWPDGGLTFWLPSSHSLSLSTASVFCWNFRETL